ncbi:hypothetical protein L9F63_013769, partial [Diploptera punctata]
FMSTSKTFIFLFIFNTGCSIFVLDYIFYMIFRDTARLSMINIIFTRRFKEPSDIKSILLAKFPDVK